jgi:hypothetical protein
MSKDQQEASGVIAMSERQEPVWGAWQSTRFASLKWLNPPVPDDEPVPAGPRPPVRPGSVLGSGFPPMDLPPIFLIDNTSAAFDVQNKLESSFSVWCHFEDACGRDIYFVSDLLQKAIMTLDPEGMDWIKCETLMIDDYSSKPRPAPDYWLGTPIRVLDALDYEKSSARYRKFSRWEPTYLPEDPDGKETYLEIQPGKAVFKRELLHDVHIFYQQHTLGRFFVTEKFRQHVSALGIEAFEFYCEGTING